MPVFWVMTTTHLYDAWLLFPSNNVCAPLGGVCVCVCLLIWSQVPCWTPFPNGGFLWENDRGFKAGILCWPVTGSGCLALMWSWLEHPAVHVWLQCLQFLPEETSLWVGGWGKEGQTCLCSGGTGRKQGPTLGLQRHSRHTVLQKVGGQRNAFAARGRSSCTTSSQKENVSVTPISVVAWPGGCAGVWESCLWN